MKIGNLFRRKKLTCKDLDEYLGKYIQIDKGYQKISYLILDALKSRREGFIQTENFINKRKAMIAELTALSNYEFGLALTPSEFSEANKKFSREGYIMLQYNPIEGQRDKYTYTFINIKMEDKYKKKLTEYKREIVKLAIECIKITSDRNLANQPILSEIKENIMKFKCSYKDIEKYTNINEFAELLLHHEKIYGVPEERIDSSVFLPRRLENQDIIKEHLDKEHLQRVLKAKGPVSKEDIEKKFDRYLKHGRVTFRQFARDVNIGKFRYGDEHIAVDYGYIKRHLIEYDGINSIYSEELIKKYPELKNMLKYYLLPHGNLVSKKIQIEQQNSLPPGHTDKGLINIRSDGGRGAIQQEQRIIIDLSIFGQEGTQEFVLFRKGVGFYKGPYEILPISYVMMAQYGGEQRPHGGQLRAYAMNAIMISEFFIKRPDLKFKICPSFGAIPIPESCLRQGMENNDIPLKEVVPELYRNTVQELDLIPSNIRDHPFVLPFRMKHQVLRQRFVDDAISFLRVLAKLARREHGYDFFCIIGDCYFYLKDEKAETLKALKDPLEWKHFTNPYITKDVVWSQTGIYFKDLESLSVYATKESYYNTDPKTALQINIATIVNNLFMKCDPYRRGRYYALVVWDSWYPPSPLLCDRLIYWSKKEDWLNIKESKSNRVILELKTIYGPVAYETPWPTWIFFPEKRKVSIKAIEEIEKDINLLHQSFIELKANIEDAYNTNKYFVLKQNIIKFLRLVYNLLQQLQKINHVLLESIKYESFEIEEVKYYYKETIKGLTKHDEIKDIYEKIFQYLLSRVEYFFIRFKADPLVRQFNLK